MSDTSGHGHSAASEIESRETAEEAREREWTQPSFLKEIFLGNLRLDLVPDFAVPGPGRPEFQAFYERMEKFLVEEVDADAIDREGKVPERVVTALAGMRVFGMKIPVEYGLHRREGDARRGRRDTLPFHGASGHRERRP